MGNENLGKILNRHQSAIIPSNHSVPDSTPFPAQLPSNTAGGTLSTMGQVYTGEAEGVVTATNDAPLHKTWLP